MLGGETGAGVPTNVGISLLIAGPGADAAVPPEAPSADETPDTRSVAAVVVVKAEIVILLKLAAVVVMSEPVTVLMPAAPLAMLTRVDASCEKALPSSEAPKMSLENIAFTRNVVQTRRARAVTSSSFSKLFLNLL